MRQVTNNKQTKQNEHRTNRTMNMEHLLAATNKVVELNNQLTAVTEQRDEARRLAEKYRYLSCDSQEEADAEVLPWENNQQTEP